MNVERIVKICYTNYKGETAIREIIPLQIWYGSTEYHPEEQWLLEAYDVDKQASRSFSLKDIRAWI